MHYYKYLFNAPCQYFALFTLSLVHGHFNSSNTLLSTARMDNLHVRLTFDLGKKKKSLTITTARKRILIEVTLLSSVAKYNPRANGAKRRSGRKPGARVTNFALGKFKVIAHGS